jgi:Polyketide cyclase / dehydrase and lipid transport
MARYVTTIGSRLPPEQAFAYMADFENARSWDPSVSEARREGGGPVGLGSAFRLVSRFAGRNVSLRYTIVRYEPPRLLVLEAEQPSFLSHDEITVERDGDGSAVRYDARLEFRGARRVLDPLLQLIFNRVGARAATGMARTLNP